jgi:hypothetical protein
MTDLESRYRRLFAAYPPAHRAEREEEMITTLLDVAEPGQTRPTVRAAAAIVANGLACRARSATEWQLGLTITGLVARVLATALAVAALGVGTLPPIRNPTRLRDRGVALEPAWLHVPPWTPVVVWAFALLAILAGGRSSWGSRRLVAPAVCAVVMVVGGADVVGMRRSYIAPFVLLLAMSTLDVTASVRKRAIAVATGAVIGATLASQLRLPWGAYEGLQPKRLWMETDRWYLAARDLVPMRPEIWLAVVVLGCLAGAIRPRFAIATGLLAIPLGLLTVRGQQLGPVEQLVLPMLLGAVALFVTATSRSRSNRSGKPGDAATA